MTSLRHNHWHAAVGLLVLLGAGRAAAAPRIEAYPTTTTVVQGGTLELHVRSELPSYLLSIWRQGITLEMVSSCGVRPGSDFPVPAQAWEGCGWPANEFVSIPTGWRPGAYVARLDAGSVSTIVPFVVRALQPGSHGAILVQLSTNTWQAYNRYGGKSLYGAFEPGLTTRAYMVSYHRPYNYFATDGSGQFGLWEAPFLAWLELQGYAYEVCTNLDLHRVPRLLDSYRAFVSVGHDEYYSKEMYDELERFVDAGGNLVFLSGNTLWWQVRFEGDGNLMVCYKDYHLDPLTGIDNARLTVNWHTPLVNRPPARLMGVYYNGSAGIPVGAYRVIDPRSWVFAGARVDSGQAFGLPMVGLEVDSRTADSPAQLQLIARVELPDANNGNVMRPCEMVYYERSPAFGFPAGLGGKVFACGSVNYVQGLMPYYNGWTRSTGSADPVATTITRNVLDRLGCSVGAPALRFPADMQVVVGGRALLQWDAAAPQRLGIPVHYTVFWQADGSTGDSLVTDVPNAWVTGWADSKPVRWRVRATSGCGATSWSLERRFVGRIATDAGPDVVPPLVVISGREQAAFWLSTTRPACGDVEVFDVAGRRMSYFSGLDLRPGSTRLTWDLRDATGRRVSAGIYLVRARIGSTVGRGRVLVRSPR